MQRHTLVRYFAASLLFACFLLAATSARSQERKIQPGNEAQLIAKSPCPRPIALTLSATTPNVVNADFNATQLGMPRAWLNDPGINKGFLYTFQPIRDEKCCEITSAILTVKLRANQAGQAQTGSDAGNDGIAIMFLGSSVPPFSEPVYSSWPFPVGQTATKTWNLTGAALAHLNATHRLSIWAQDDSAVLSATLQLSGCCVNSSPREAAEQ
jgi:hypothetical protein